MARADREKLGQVVEVDETYIGGLEEGKQGRGAEKKSLVVLAVELTSDHKRMGRIRIAVIPDASSSSLIPFINQNVVPDSLVVTDGWKGYLPLRNEKFRHDIKIMKKDKDLLPHVHLVLSLIKRWSLGTFQGSINHNYLNYYLDEFVFRFNRRTSSSCGKLFRRLMEQAVNTPPVTRKELQAKMQPEADSVNKLEKITYP